MRIGRTIPPAASPIYIKDIINGLKGLLRGHREIERFRTELKNYFGVKHCFLVSSGKAALSIILQALHNLHPKRDEVLIPAFICYSVPSAIVRAGLKVKLCDVNPDTLDFDYNDLKCILSIDSHLSSNSQDSVTLRSRLLSIIPAHLFGLPVQINGLRDIVNDPKITIIEDAAQAMGADWNGRKLGTIGDVGFFSLGRGKALSTVEGGIILTDQDNIADYIYAQVRNLSSHNLIESTMLFIYSIMLCIFLHPSLFWFPTSLPFLKLGETKYDPSFKMRKMDSFQAGLSRGWRKKLKFFKEVRSKNSRRWSELIRTLNNKGLTSIGKISETSGNSSKQIVPKTQTVPSTRENQSTNFIRFPVRIDDNSLWKKILLKSKDNGLGIIFTYPDSINGIDELREMFNGQVYTAAEKLPRQLITFPVHPFISKKDIKNISMLLIEIIER